MYMRLSTEDAISEYWNSIYTVAFSICKNQMDAEDVAQDTFVKYHLHKKQFDNKEHLRAWLIKVTINAARNSMKAFWKKNKVSFDEYLENETQITAAEFDDPARSFTQKENALELIKEVLKLPEKYRIVVHLFYYEDYSCDEISGLLRISENAVRKRLSRGREMLKNRLSEEFSDD